MDSATEILFLIFLFVVVLVIINNIHELMMKRGGYKDGEVRKKLARKMRKRRGALDAYEVFEAPRKDSSQMSREELLAEMDKLNERIKNMEVILKGREKDGDK